MSLKQILLIFVIEQWNVSNTFVPVDGILFGNSGVPLFLTRFVRSIMYLIIALFSISAKS